MPAVATIAPVPTPATATKPTVTADSVVPSSATVVDDVEKVTTTEPTQVATVLDKSEEIKKIDSLLNDLQDDDDLGTSVTDSVAKEQETAFVPAVKEADVPAEPVSVTTTTTTTTPAADSKATIGAPLEAMDVEDSSSNDVEMQDLSQNDLKIGGDGQSKADAATTAAATVTPATTASAATASKLETIPDRDEPDSKKSAELIVPSTGTNAEKSTAVAVVAAKPEVKPLQSLVDSASKEPVIDHDEVEKNISNLFNGEESGAEITSSLLDKPSSNAKVPENNGGQTVDSRSLNNGKAGSDGKSAPATVAKSKDECAKELVSILEDDKLPTKDLVAPAKIDNKVLSILKNGSSTPNQQATATTAVFNSTPIQRQFDISSENVSTISVATADGNKSEVHIDLEPTSTDTSAISKSDGATGEFAGWIPP